MPFSFVIEKCMETIGATLLIIQGILITQTTTYMYKKR